MSVVVNMKWEGVTPELYNAALDIVQWEAQPAEGGLYHVASFDNNALYVTDVWESPADFQRFVEQRLMPGVARLNIDTEPQVEVRPVHRIFAAGYVPKSEEVA